MYFYQKNFIYDVSSYTKTKNTSNNSITISDINISDLSYYNNLDTRPQILLSTGNFSPWGAKDVLLSNRWYIGYNPSTGRYNLNLFISNTDITSYDINQIKYLIFLDDVYFLQINSSDENFDTLKFKNNIVLSVKFNNNTTKDFYLPLNTILTKTNDYIDIRTTCRYLLSLVNFNSNAQREINLSSNGYNNFPHFINIKLQRPSNTSDRVLRLRLIVIDRNNTTNTLQTYYFSTPAGQTLNTFSIVPCLTDDLYYLNHNSKLRLNLAWTSDGNTLTTENTSVEVQCIWFLPTNNFRIYF
jgi:hypothetical protein